jgi:cobalt-precorrin 5A hydrolase
VNRILPADPLPDASAPADNALALGIGCRSGVTLAQVEAAVQAQLGNRGDGGDGGDRGEWTLAQVKVVATLDAKAAEPALLAFCAAHALPLRTFTREEVASVEAHALPSAPSAAAQARFGVAGVCEPCACLAAAGGPLVRAKLALDGVTVALAAFANQVTPKPQD